MMLKNRRGRPAKLTFNEAVDQMVAEDNKVNWEKLAKKQETELRIVRGENDDLAKICVERWNEIEYLNKLVKYLEGKYEDLAIRSSKSSTKTR